MDPQHRDRIAFVRICSGRFVRGMDVQHVRTGKTLTLARSVQFMAQTRTVVDEAFSGDIVGLWIGGSAHRRQPVRSAAAGFEGIPRFRRNISCACASTIRSSENSSRRAGTAVRGRGVQVFYDRQRMERDPILVRWARCSSKSSSTACAANTACASGSIVCLPLCALDRG